jgi:hypothetical protein
MKFLNEGQGFNKIDFTHFIFLLKKRNKGYVGNVKMKIFWRNGYKIKSNTALLVEVISIWRDLNF